MRATTLRDENGAAAPQSALTQASRIVAVVDSPPLHWSVGLKTRSQALFDHLRTREIMSRFPAQRAQEHGAAAVEFALVLPLLLLLIFGMVDFSRAYNAHISLSGAAREGARVLALGTGDPVQVTKDAAPTISEPIDVVCPPDGCASACANAGDQATVRASIQFDYITPVSGLMSIVGGDALASPITITGIGVMRCGG